METLTPRSQALSSVLVTPSTDRLVFIDSLRGLASLAVLLFHFYGVFSKDYPGLAPGPLHDLLSHGDLGVQLFFVLSGFVIAKTISVERVDLKYVGKFVVRRSIRLDPPYWTVIFLTLLFLFLTGKENPALQHILINMFYLDNLTGAPSFVAVGWTLQYEFQFYLFFIGLLYLFVGLLGMDLKRTIVPLMLIFVLSLLTYEGIVLSTPKGLFIDNWFLFFGGCLVYWTVRGGIGVGYYILYLTGVCSLFLFYPDARVLAGVSATLLLFFAGKFDKMNSWLNIPWLLFLGRISYSLYIVHPLFGNKLLRYLEAKFHFAYWEVWGVLFFVTIITVALTYVFYIVVERSSIRLSYFLSRKVFNGSSFSSGSV